MQWGQRIREISGLNIFLLDNNPVQCARYYYDSHIVKMILESAQLLCTALWQSGGQAPYRPTHLKHPCAVWVSASLANWLWLKNLASHLNSEYQYRYHKLSNHKSYDIIQGLPLPAILDIGLTPHPQVMPELYRGKNTVLAYRRYYLGDKAHLAKWTNRNIPAWFINLQKKTVYFVAM